MDDEIVQQKHDIIAIHFKTPEETSGFIKGMFQNYTTPKARPCFLQIRISDYDFNSERKLTYQCFDGNEYYVNTLRE